MSKIDLDEIFDGVKVNVGLRAQGKFDTVKTMLAEGESWDAIGKAIGWAGHAVKEWYLMESNSKIDAPVEDSTKLHSFQEPLEKGWLKTVLTDVRKEVDSWTAPVEDTAENHCPACLQGQSLEAGEGTHREGTVEHPVEGTAVEDIEDAVLEMFIAERMMVAAEWNVATDKPISSRTLEGIDAEVNLRIRTKLLAALTREQAEKARIRELEKRLAEAEGYLSIACADMARAGIQPYLRKNIAAFLSQGSGKTK